MAVVKRIKPFTPNPDNLVNGEMLPCIGGPLDGELRKVEMLFGVMPNAGFSHEKNHFYKREGRTYVHCDPKVNRYAHLGITKSPATQDGGNDSAPQAAVPFIRAGTDSTGGAGGAV